MRPFEYAPAGSLEEALDLLDEYGDDAHLLAGGTSVVLFLNQGLIQPGVVVGLPRTGELSGIREAAGCVEIGALTTLREVETDPLVRDRVPALAEAVGRVATVRVRNQGTLGGNIAHADPAQDPPPILLVHDAEVVLASSSDRRVLPLADLFLDVFETAIAHDEVLTTIRVPVPSPNARFASVKFLPRTVDDYATVSVAARIDLAPDGTIADARLALGSVGPIPLRATQAEAVLRGASPDRASIDEAAALAAAASDPVDDLRGSAPWKREMVRVWTARVLARLLLRQEEAA